MGGNMLGIGNNYKLTSEFNFFGDPEAAKCVLDNFPQHVSFANIIKGYMYNCFDRPYFSALQQ